uniref:Uncharacterized protein n=3 Tax=viral metagenome TaxID=1070528 RepID=A0A6M3J8C6_9ZZZZ
MNIQAELQGRIVEYYLFIDRMNEGLGVIRPEEDESISYWYEYHGDHATTHLIHRKHGLITRMVNAVDLADIKFKEEAK